MSNNKTHLPSMNTFRFFGKTYFPYAETTLELPGWGGKIHACAVEDLVTITRGLKTRSIEKKRCSAVHSM